MVNLSTRNVFAGAAAGLSLLTLGCGGSNSSLSTDTRFSSRTFSLKLTPQGADELNMFKPGDTIGMITVESKGTILNGNLRDQNTKVLIRFDYNLNNAEKQQVFFSGEANKFISFTPGEDLQINLRSPIGQLPNVSKADLKFNIGDFERVTGIIRFGNDSNSASSSAIVDSRVVLK